MSQPETTPHEIEGRWKWPNWGRGPYDALSSVMLGHPFEGHLELDVEFDQEGNPKRLRIDAILSMLKGNSYESARRVAQEAIDAWRHSGNDVLHFSGVQMVWRTPGGGHDSHRVGKLADW